MKTGSRFLRLLSFCLLLACLFSFAGCSKYRVEMSNEKQSRVVMTVDGRDVTFETVYFFYRTYAEANPDESHAARLSRVQGGICELYAIFALCEAYEIDPFGEYMNGEVDANVRDMIDEFPTRRDYIERLSERHMTDTVSRLLLRSYLCEEWLSEKMELELEKDETLRAFLAREDILRVLSMSLDFGSQTEALRRRAEEIVTALAEAEDTDEAFLTVARNKATSYSAHAYITREQWASLCGEDGPAPEKGTVTAPLYEGSTCLFLRVSDKDIEYAMDNRGEILYSYLDTAIKDEATRLSPSVTLTDAFHALTEADFAS